MTPPNDTSSTATLSSMLSGLLPLVQTHHQLMLLALHQADQLCGPSADVQGALAVLHDQSWALAKRAVVTYQEHAAEPWAPVATEPAPPLPPLTRWDEVKDHLATLQALHKLLGQAAANQRLEAVNLRVERPSVDPAEPTAPDPAPPHDPAPLHAPASAEALEPEPTAPQGTLLAEDMQLELGVSLISAPFVEQLIACTKALRRQFIAEYGVELPPLHVRDNLHLPAEQYRLQVREEVIAAGTIHATKRLALSPDGEPIDPSLEGTRCTDPAFGLRACWIDPAQSSEAEALGYTVVDAQIVLSTHLAEVSRAHLHEIFSFPQLDGILDALQGRSPRLSRALQEAGLSDHTLLTVFRGLLQEGVSIRGAERIVETCIEHAGAHPRALIAASRARLARTLHQAHADDSATLHALALAPAVEAALGAQAPSWDSLSLATSPAHIRALTAALAARVSTWEESTLPVLVVESGWLRAALAPVLRETVPTLTVLSRDELPPAAAVHIHGPPVAPPAPQSEKVSEAERQP